MSAPVPYSYSLEILKIKLCKKILIFIIIFSYTFRIHNKDRYVALLVLNSN